MTRNGLGWRDREPPLAVVGVMAVDSAAAVLARRLASTDAGALGALQVYADDRVLIVLGEPAALPWVDGVAWLGKDGPILCPATMETDLPTDLIARAVRRSGDHDGIVVVAPTMALCLKPSVGGPAPEQLLSFASTLESTT